MRKRISSIRSDIKKNLTAPKPMKYVAYLDLTESGKSRNEIRLMEKGVRENKHYLGKIGNVYFFQFDEVYMYQNFFLSILTDLRSQGHIAFMEQKGYNLKNLTK